MGSPRLRTDGELALKSRSLLFHFLTVGLTGLSAGCFTAGGVPGEAGEPSSAGPSGRCITLQDDDRVTDQVLQLLNLERAERDLPPVVMNDQLKAIAGDFACRMISENFFSHRDPLSGHGPAERAVAGKYAFFAIGENLAAGVETATEVMDLWMESESHRAIILDPIWKEVGIGVRTGGEHGIYWVLEFGDPAELQAFGR